MSDIDTIVVDSLKALDPEWPIREADIAKRRVVPGRENRRMVALVGLVVSFASSF